MPEARSQKSVAFTMRRRRIEEHDRHEAWAIPYGDLITLLLAFFVVMYAVSSVNEGKYRVLSDALHAEFRGQPRSPNALQVGEKQNGLGGDFETGIAQKELFRDQPRDETKAKETAAAAERAANLEHVAKDVETSMKKLIDADLLSVKRHGLWVEVEIQTDILFGSGAATLSPLATGVLVKLADAIKPFDNPVRVEGYTDNVPIKTAMFPSNWELSAARAATVVNLFTRRGIDPKRLTVVGLGEQQPVKSNDTAEGRNANRRVVLAILGTDNLPSGARGYERGKDEPPASADATGVIQSGPAADAASKAANAK